MYPPYVKCTIRKFKCSVLYSLASNLNNLIEGFTCYNLR